MVSRSEWGAVDYNYTQFKLKKPEYVIICHTGMMDECLTKIDCIRRVKELQEEESQFWEEIRYNFLVGGDGNIYVGRGWDFAGDHTYRYNKISIGIALLGNYFEENVSKKQIKALKNLIDHSYVNNKVTVDYKFTARGRIYGTEDPGYNVTKITKNWPHWTDDPSIYFFNEVLKTDYTSQEKNL